MQLDMSSYAKSRAEAAERQETHYYTGKACKHGHIATRFASNGTCTECIRLAAAKNYYREIDFVQGNPNL
jgi:hypothetical protein